MSVPRIAERLGRHRSTIHREIRRNWHDDGPWLRGYFPQAAQSRTERRRRRRRKLHQDPDLARYVIARLQQAWSPEQIAGRLRREAGATRLSHETIYRFVYSDVGREQNLYQLLPCQRRRRRKRYARKPRGVTIPLENTFPERPAEIAERSSFGHWEGDLVMFRRAHGQRNVLSLVERQTRFAVLRVQPSRHSKPIMNSLAEDLGGLPPGPEDRDVRPRNRVRRLPRPEDDAGDGGPFLCSPGALAERHRREHERPAATLSATRLEHLRAKYGRPARPRRPDERHAAQVPGVHDAGGGVRRLNPDLWVIVGRTERLKVRLSDRLQFGFATRCGRCARSAKAWSGQRQSA